MYIVQEIQTNGNSSAVTPAVQKATREEADSVFFFALGAAAVSAVQVHAVLAGGVKLGDNHCGSSRILLAYVLQLVADL